jgi:DNA-binding transcriptional ArsR family regulator
LKLLAHRNESNLSRALKKLRDAGIVEFEERGGRTRAPRLIARRVKLLFCRARGAHERPLAAAAAMKGRSWLRLNFPNRRQEASEQGIRHS